MLKSLGTRLLVVSGLMVTIYDIGHVSEDNTLGRLEVNGWREESSKLINKHQNNIIIVKEF